MKKLVLLLIMGLLLSGCISQANESEFFKHGAMYKNWDHFKFSAWGYKQPTEETFKQTWEQKWWGKPIILKSKK